MSKLPTFADASDAASTAAAHGRTLIPWLPDPERCPECDAMMYASETFDSRMAAPVASWHCQGCDQHYERDPVYGEAVLDGPRPGSSQLRELLNDVP